MVDFDQTSPTQDGTEPGAASLSRIEAMMNENQRLIVGYAAKYGIEIDEDNRITGETDLLDYDPEAFDKWVEARSNMHAIGQAAAAFGCEVSRGSDGAWRAMQARKPHVLEQAAAVHDPLPEVSQCIDPKGRVVLETRGRDALLFRGGRYQPYVVAHGYDGRTGEWSHGNYLETAAEAAEALNPAVRLTAKGKGGRYRGDGR